MARNPESIPYFAEIEAAMAESGCAICTLTTNGAVRYVDNLLWQMVNEIDIRAALNAARGYCQIHAWMLNRRGGALGVAILMRDVIKTLLRATDATTGSKSRSAWNLWRNAPGGDLAETVSELKPQTLCPISAHVRGLEHELTMTLLDNLHGEQGLAATYRRSDGICLPHFRKLLTHAQPRHNTELLLATQREAWTRLHEDLSEFIRKNDHRFHDEKITMSEADSWQVALAEISGPDPASGAESAG